MTRATAEVFGLIEECTDDGLIRIANIFFQLPEGESAAVGQFARASLAWRSESLWEAKEVSVYDADPSEQVLSEKQVAAEVAQTAISNAQHQAIASPTPTAPTPIRETPATQPTAKRLAGFGGFSKSGATQVQTPAKTSAAVPLRAPPTAAPFQAPTTTDTASKQQKTETVTPISASRFGGIGKKSTVAARPAAPASVGAAKTSTSEPATVKSMSRFGASMGARSTSIARPIAATVAERPAFDPMSDFSDDDIPF